MRVCPVCGSLVKIDAPISFTLNEEDVFVPDMPDPETIAYNLDLPNNQCYCTNRECGLPVRDADDHEIPADLVRACQGNLLAVYCILNNKDYDVMREIVFPDKIKLDESEDLSDDELRERKEIRNEYFDWENGLEYEPWKGIIADLREV